jgi:hypothetical protein
MPERTIREVQLFEFGPVVFPAYPAATAGMRSLTDHYLECLREKRAGHLPPAFRDTATPPVGHLAACDPVALQQSVSALRSRRNLQGTTR